MYKLRILISLVDKVLLFDSYCNLVRMFFMFIYLVELGSELRTVSLLDTCSTSWGMPPTLSFSGCFLDSVSLFAQASVDFDPPTVCVQPLQDFRCVPPWPAFSHWHGGSQFLGFGVFFAAETALQLQSSWF